MVLVFDIGATRTRVALVSGGVLDEVVRVETDPRPTGFATFLGLIQELATGHKIEAVCGGMAGQLEGEEEGRLIMTPNLPAWVGVSVMRQLRSLFDCPIHVLNDVMLGGLGESHAGAGSTKGVMAYFTISTGVNAVRIVDGRVDTSIVRYEIGRHLVEEKGGKVMTLESLVGGAALQKRYGKKPREIRDKAVWTAEEQHLAHGLYNVILDWTPELVVLGGSMMRDIHIQNLADDLKELPNVLSKWPRLKRAKLGDTAGLVGALKYLDQLAAK